MKYIMALKPFTDLEVGRKRQRDEIFETSDERGAELVNHPGRVAKYVDMTVDPIPAPEPKIDVQISPVSIPEAPKEYDLTPPLKTEENFDNPTKLVVDANPTEDSAFISDSVSSLKDSATVTQPKEEKLAEQAKPKAVKPKTPKKVTRKYRGAKNV